MQVTQSKTSLEQALKLTKKLKKESASLREFVMGINKELSKREMPTAAKDIEDELVWAKVSDLTFLFFPVVKCTLAVGCISLTLSKFQKSKIVRLGLHKNRK